MYKISSIEMDLRIKTNWVQSCIEVHLNDKIKSNQIKSNLMIEPTPKIQDQIRSLNPLKLVIKSEVLDDVISLQYVSIPLDP